MSPVMEITPQAILDRGVKALGNHPDNLTRRILLAQILVDARLVKSIDAGINAFRIWSVPESRNHTLEAILTLANERTQT